MPEGVSVLFSWVPRIHDMYDNYQASKNILMTVHVWLSADTAFDFMEKKRFCGLGVHFFFLKKSSSYFFVQLHLTYHIIYVFPRTVVCKLGR